jgi:hypothetical protein
VKDWQPTPILGAILVRVGCLFAGSGVVFSPSIDRQHHRHHLISLQQLVPCSLADMAVMANCPAWIASGRDDQGK